MNKISNHHIGLLREAIDDAESLKGGLMAEEYPEFEAHIAKMRVALEQVKLMRKSKVNAAVKVLDAELTAEIGRRVPVEQYLLDVANGKHPLPDKDKCRELARKLGVE